MTTRGKSSARPGSASKLQDASLTVDAAFLAKVAKAELNRPALKKYRFKVFENEIWHQNNRWFVPIDSQSNSIGVFDCAKQLNRIEEKLEKRGLNVTLFPAAGLTDMGR